MMGKNADVNKELSDADELLVERFCRQLLQLEIRPDFPPGHILRTDSAQQRIFQLAYCEETAPYLPPPRYRLLILQSLVTLIESSIDDWDTHGLSDNLALALSGLLSSPIPPLLSTAQEREYVTYHLSALPAASTPPQITLLERRAVISAGGTTGFRTWEAALHLGQFLCSDPSVIADKRVLELGAGTGYLSVLCAKHLDAAQVIASDGSDDVINNLPDNFFINGLQGSEKIRPTDLKWGHAIVGTEEESWNGGEPLDVVLGADITYDRSVIPALLGTLQELVDMFPGVSILVAATERNKETFGFFLDACVRAGLVATTVLFEVPRWSEQMGPFYDCSVPIHICKLSKR